MYTKISDKILYTNSVDSDQTAPSGSILFAIPLSILRNKLQKSKMWVKQYGIKCLKLTSLYRNIFFIHLSFFFLHILEKGDVRTKTDALKKTIQMILNGEKMPSLLMTIIRFVMPLQDHTIKKLLLIFWEVVPKYTPDGKMLHEMILVCDAYRKVGYSVWDL